MKREIGFTLLVDNQAAQGLVTEHGFSAWIDTGDIRILFDTGAGNALLANAAQLGVDLAQADFLVLSHGHYDHTGGLADFLSINPHAQIHFGQGMAVARCSCHPGAQPREIGIPERDYRELRALNPQRICEWHTHGLLAGGICITGPIPRLHPLEDTGGPFFMDAGKKQADSIGDDLALWFETRRGLVIVTGCCHSGLINTIEHVRRISGQTRVSGIVGGLHLLHAGDERMMHTIAALAALDLDFLIPAHCTGEDQTRALVAALGEDVVRPACAGMSFLLGELQ